MYFRRTKHKRRLSILKVKDIFAVTFNLILTPNIIVTTPYNHNAQQYKKPKHISPESRRHFL